MARRKLRRRLGLELLEARLAPAFGISAGISLIPSGTATGDSSSYFDVQTLDSSGSLQVFTSDSTNLVAIDGNGTTDVFVRNLNTNVTSLVSVNSLGTGSGNSDSYKATISGNGRYVAFVSQATNLTGIAPFGYQVFRRDLLLGTTALVSVSSTGASTANDWSEFPTMSADGRYVAFRSYGDNLVAGLVDGNGAADIFVRDMVLGQTVCVSVTPAGTAAGNADSYEATVARDGGAVVFASIASNLVAGVTDNNDTTDLFVRNLSTSITSLVSKMTSAPATGDQLAVQESRSLSSDGRYEVFTSVSNAFVHGVADLNTATDVFVRDLLLGTTSLVSVSSSGTQTANAGSDQAIISGNGRYVVFRSFASDLTAANISGAHFYRRDLQTNATVLVDFNSSNTDAANGSPEKASMSEDGRYIAFASWADDLVAGVTDLNFDNDIFVRDMQTSTNELASAASAGSATGNAPANNPVLSADGTTVVFESASTNLVAGATDNNTFADLFSRNLVSNTTLLVSRVEAGSSTGDQMAFRGAQAMSDDGRYEVFASGSTFHVAGVVDLNGQSDVFVRDRLSGTNTLVSRNTAGAAGNAGSFDASISGDGRYVIFMSDATDLTATPVASTQLYRWDRISNTMALVSINSAGTGGGNNVFGGSISDDGNIVVFSSTSNNLTSTTDTNGVDDVFSRNMSTLTTQLVSKNSAGSAAGNNFSGGGIVSGDGTHVAFSSNASNLTSISDTNNDSDAFVRILASGITKLASINSAGTAAARGGTTSISDDGNIVCFESAAGNIAPSDSNGLTDVFVYDVAADDVIVVSLNTAGTSTGTNSSFHSYVSGNGAFVVFASTSTTIHPLANSFSQVYRRNLATSTTELMSINSAGAAGGNNHSTEPHCSDNGNIVAFESFATNLPGVANNSNADIYFRNVAAASTVFVSINSAGSNSGNGPSTNAFVSGNGGHLTWTTMATDLLAGVSDYNDDDIDVYGHTISGGTNDLVSAKGAGLFASAVFTPTPSLSSNGQRIAWVEQNDVTIAKDNNGNADIVVFDAPSTTNLLASIRSDGTTSGNNSSLAPALSADGQSVAFLSFAFDLVSNDINFSDGDVFVRNLLASSTELISVNSSATGSGNGDCVAVAMSADGNIVAFTSTGMNYVAGIADGNGVVEDVFVRNRSAGTTVLASTRSSGTSSSNGASYEPVVSANGSRVTFETFGTDLLVGVVDFNGDDSDIYARSLTAGTLALVTTRATGAFTGNNVSDQASISNDGSRVAFRSYADDLTALDGNVFEDVYLWEAGVVSLVSIDSTGTTSGNNLSHFPAISGNGQYVAFSSRATNLTSLNGNGIVEDVFRRSLAANATVMVSLNSAGTGGGNGAAERSVINEAGTVIAFESLASNHVATPDANGTWDVFVREMLAGTSTLASRNSAGAGNNMSYGPDLSANGAAIAFVSFSTNLVAGVTDANFSIDVFAARQNDTTAPTIVGVYFDGSLWAPAFRAAAGNATYGYPAQTGAFQLRPMPWSTIDRVHIAFSENVTIANGNLGLRGVNVATYPTSLAYNSVNFVATFSVAAVFDTDRVLIDLDGDGGSAVVDAAGNKLAGSWTEESSSFPSAGAAGVDFLFRFVVAVGDVGRNGQVRNADLNAVRNNLFVDIGMGGYDMLTDIDGNGLVRNADLNVTRNHLFIDAPSGPGPFRGARVGGQRTEDRIARLATQTDTGNAVKTGDARDSAGRRRYAVHYSAGRLIDELFSEA